MNGQIFTVTVQRKADRACLFTRAFRTIDTALNVAKEYREQGYLTFTDTTTIKDY